MIVVLAAGVTALEEQIHEQLDLSANTALLGIPKALLPLSGKSSLSWWWQLILQQHQQIPPLVYIVASPQSFKPLERWAIGAGIPTNQVLSTGSAHLRSPKDAFIDTLSVALRVAWSSNPSDTITPSSKRSIESATLSPTCNSGQEEILPLTILGSDFLPDKLLLDSWSTRPDEASVLVSPDGVYLLAIKMGAMLKSDVMNYIDLLQTEGWNSRYNSHLEARSDPSATIGTTNPTIGTTTVTTTNLTITSFDRFVQWLDGKGCLTKHVVQVNHPLIRWMDPLVSLCDYHSYWKTFTMESSSSNMSKEMTLAKPIHSRVYARIGLMGNPSDGFYGKTLSTTISNFWASVTLLPNKDTLDPSVLFVANAMCDYTVFGSIQTAHRVAQIDGYDGATRLLLATLRVFVQYCLDNGITLNRCGMRIVYQTNIPRQVGLAGSSALVTSLIKCLVRFYDISDSLFPLWAQANLALSAERDELGIAAGLQDRVVQAYGGCVHMNFDQHLMTSRGYGEYQILDTASIPLNIWMAYVRQPKESGQVHHTVKQRFESGDQEVVQGMQYLGGLAHQAQLAMISGDTPALARLFDDNFALRRKLYGDEVIGAQTLKIVDLAHMHGHAAKLSGSGGCVIGLWRDADLTAFVDRTRKLQLEIEREGFIFCFVDVPRN
ncbi:hypothetical protein BASA60_007206 [Batrachochytrium salamandrivorans]|nr:hypothetical protein BASA60_007206 [Batrachochytrium salamandrivorans]